MANFYTEHPELKFHLNNPLMERICQLKERDYRDKDEFDYAPQDYADAIDSYDKVLEITGEITGEVIAANAALTRKVLTVLTDVWNTRLVQKQTLTLWLRQDLTV